MTYKAVVEKLVKQKILEFLEISAHESVNPSVIKPIEFDRSNAHCIVFKAEIATKDPTVYIEVAGFINREANIVVDLVFTRKMVSDSPITCERTTYFNNSLYHDIKNFDYSKYM